jgi:hypothetical protein
MRNVHLSCPRKNPRFKTDKYAIFEKKMRYEGLISVSDELPLFFKVVLVVE